MFDNINNLENVDIVETKNGTLEITVDPDFTLDEVSNVFNSHLDDLWRIALCDGSSTDTIHVYKGYGKLVSIDDAGSGKTKVTLRKFTEDEFKELVYNVLFETRGGSKNVNARITSIDDHTDRSMMNIILSDIGR